MYYRGAQAAIVVYDIQNQDSFVRAQTWVKELQRQVSFISLCFLCYNNFTYLNSFLGFTQYRHSIGWQ